MRGFLQTLGEADETIFGTKISLCEKLEEGRKPEAQLHLFCIRLQQIISKGTFQGKQTSFSQLKIIFSGKKTRESHPAELIQSVTL